MGADLLVSVVIRYLVQILSTVQPALPGYGKLAAAAILSGLAAVLGAARAPADLQQALPAVGTALAAAITWGLSDAVHGVLNYFERLGAKGK